jgi:hypothetical protein
LTRAGIAVNVLEVTQAIIPISVAYAVLKHRVIDVEFVINRAIALGALLGVLLGTLALLDWLYTNYVMQTRWQIAFGLAVAFAIGWGARSMRRRLVTLIDALFFRKRFEVMRSVNELRLALEAEDTGDIDRFVVEGASSALQLSSAAIFIRMSDGGFLRQSAVGWDPGTVWHLFPGDPVVEQLLKHGRRTAKLDERAWRELRAPDGAARPLLAVPVGSSKGAVALYGGHDDGRDIDPDEIRALRDLCAAAPATRITR